LKVDSPALLNDHTICKGSDMSFVRRGKTLTIIAFILFSGIVIWLWQRENLHKRNVIYRYTETTAEQIRIRIEGLMNARMASLHILAARWVERRPPDFTRKRFFGFAEAFCTHYPGFWGINWIDPEGVIQWNYPERQRGNEGGRNILHQRDPLYRRAFQDAREMLGTTFTPCLELYDGDLGFDTFWPLIFEDKIQGYLNGVFKVNLIVATSLGQKILKDFWVRIYEDGRLVYVNVNRGEEKPGRGRLRALRAINFRGKTWELDLEPKAHINRLGINQGFPLLIFGLTISATLSLLLYFLIQRMQMLREARDRALHEVNERKKAEEALLEHEKQLKTLVSKIEAKNAELETFVYSVSHDLKTPIVTIDGFISALREDFGETLPEDGHTYLTYISDATHKMAVLINDLLDLSRIGRVHGKMEEIDLQLLLEEVQIGLQSQIKEKGIEVNIQKGLPPVYGERKGLFQVMENLMLNAVKYIGEDNARPCIDVGMKRKNGQDIYFVRDNGIGIKKIYFNKIFEVFQRLPSTKEIEEGTGIGLAIVKRIIEHHGGKIWVSSEPGKGTTFFFTLEDKET
jgi:signal transduction histidine kinase